MTKQQSQSTEYVESCALEYAMYVLMHRAIPAATDGLKASGRRVLWTGRDGKKWKTASLAGATMPIHPHDAPDDAINKLAAQYGNNIPLFTGGSAFGTLLEPTEYSASRYTDVHLSEFAKEAVMVDLDIVPMRPNYDGTLQEPVHFLPLVPLALLNPTQGIAIGFKSNILSRSLEDIIIAQLAHLRNAKNISCPIPKFLPTSNCAAEWEDVPSGTRYTFYGDYEQINSSTIRIHNLPYGKSHNDVINGICDLYDSFQIVEFTDASRDTYDITVKFPRGFLAQRDKADVLKMLGLVNSVNEILNVLNFDGTYVWNPTPLELIREFTNWRLGWYVKRYERLRDLLLVEIQRYRDIRTAITNNVGGIAKVIQSRSDLKDRLSSMEIVYVDYIADLPVYRFTSEEAKKNEDRLKEAEKQLQRYNDLIASESERKKVYISELQYILSQYSKGRYTTT